MGKFFSISTKDIYPFRRKTIKICGIKFSYKYRPKKMLLSLPESEVSRMGICSNRNLIFYVIDYLQRHDNDVLYCLKNDMVCYIFNKRILDWGVDNFRQFIINSPWLLQKILDFQILQPYSNLYQDHIERAAKGEFFWKYTLKKD